jgi:hypothetical protein
MRSERLKAVWGAKRVKGEPLTGMCPAWLRLVDGEWRTIEKAAAAIRRVYELATAGLGILAITKKMNAEGLHLPIGPGKFWSKTYVRLLLASRAVIGEFQPHKYVVRPNKKDPTRKTRARVPSGDPVPGYFPAILSEKQWNMAQAAMDVRRGKPGRRLKWGLNIFQGLLVSAVDGSSLTVTHGGKRSAGPRVSAYSARMGVGSKQLSFSFQALERAILSYLREVDPKDILERANGHDEVMALEGEDGVLQTKLDKMQALFEADPSDTVAKSIKKLEDQQKLVRERLVLAKRKAANPLSTVWGEAKSLLEVLEGLPPQEQEEARLRLRQALRRIVKSIRVLVIPEGQARLCWVGIWFTDEVFRGLFIAHRQGVNANGCKRPPMWRAESWAGDLNVDAAAFAAGMEAHLKALEQNPDYEPPDDPEASGFGPQVELEAWYERVKDQPGWQEL